MLNQSTIPTSATAARADHGPGVIKLPPDPATAWLGLKNSTTGATNAADLTDFFKNARRLRFAASAPAETAVSHSSGAEFGLAFKAADSSSGLSKLVSSPFHPATICGLHIRVLSAIARDTNNRRIFRQFHVVQAQVSRIN
jgi:hypothetical protein